MYSASKPAGGVAFTAPLTGPTSNSPGGTVAVLLTVDGSDWSTKVGIVNVPSLAFAMHSTRMPGVVAEGSRPDARVVAMAVMSTKPLGSPPLQVIVRGVSRGIAPAVTVL